MKIGDLTEAERAELSAFCRRHADSEPPDGLAMGSDYYRWLAIGNMFDNEGKESSSDEEVRPGKQWRWRT